MRRRQPQETEAPGHDSFLDIVANIVGILVILVMVTGVRAKNWTQPEPPKETVSVTDVALEAAALEKDQTTEISLRRDMAGLLGQQRQLAAEMLAQDRARMRLATAVAGMEKEIASRRSQLSAESQQDLQLRQELAEAQAGLDRVKNEIQVAERSDAPPRLIESYPTPLSKPVDDGEIHFQLKGGWIAFIPLEKLMHRVEQDVKPKLHRLNDLPEITDTVGPDGGFRLRYTVVRRDVSIETQLAAGMGGIIPELALFTLIPTDNQLGETTDQALAVGSRFREIIASSPPDSTVITIWVYPDSFADFARLKEELYKMGYSAAGRPIPNGVPIGGSPQGTKSAAQ